MDTTALALYGILYLGLMLGGVPGLALDRTGIALLGMILFLVTGRLDHRSVMQAIDYPTLALLFGFMIVSAQFRLSGAYSFLVRTLAERRYSAPVFLLAVILTSALLSALLANDIVCLAVTPVLIEVCLRMRIDPKPYLLALACAANIGSAATLIGNPQNMLIGQVLNLSFGHYLLQAIPPVLIGLGLLWVFLKPRCCAADSADPTDIPPVQAPAFSQWQASKGLILLFGLVTVFLTTHWPRELAALAAAALLLCSRRMHSRDMLSLVDWPLLTLFIALFAVNHAFAQAGGLTGLQSLLNMMHIHLNHWAWVMTLSAVLANLVSNVPSVMLLLKLLPGPQLAPVLAISSTFAGNLLIIGSIANLIVIEQAARAGVVITWRDHARVGVPVTLASLGVSALWFMWLGF